MTFKNATAILVYDCVLNILGEMGGSIFKNMNLGEDSRVSDSIDKKMWKNKCNLQEKVFI